jgi:NADP-dependent 3-hydroxy acid dehydrogenase YdfG
MKILITGNPDKALANELSKIYPSAVFVSRISDIDLTTTVGHKRLADMSVDFDIFINCSALWKFNQTVLLDTVYKKCLEFNRALHIINIGSTVDRVKNGKPWLYNAEKKALRDYSNTLALSGVWSDNLPKITYISFGTLSNNQEKHPERKCIDMQTAAEYIKWVIDQPKHIAINEISIDPMQGNSWYE